MSDKTKIAWCDSSVNFWTGCTKTGPGCINCYAAAQDHRFARGAHWGPGKPRVPHLESARKKALAWNKKPWICDQCGRPSPTQWCSQHEPQDALCHRRRVFANSVNDWLDPEVPVEWLAAMLDTIRLCPELTWIFCTKRPELWSDRIERVRYELDECTAEYETWMDQWRDGFAPTNLWLLTSIENQDAADKRIPELLKIPAAVRGLSIEPLLEKVNLGLFGTIPKDISTSYVQVHDRIGWVIVGGETGPRARPCNIEWIRDIAAQCREASVPCFVKQLGSIPIIQDLPSDWTSKHGLGTELYCPDGEPPKAPGGANPSEWPEDLRVREYPI